MTDIAPDPKPMTVQARVSPQLHSRLSEEARLRNTSVNALVGEAIERYLNAPLTPVADAVLHPRADLPGLPLGRPAPGASGMEGVVVGHAELDRP